MYLHIYELLPTYSIKRPVGKLLMQVNILLLRKRKKKSILSRTEAPSRVNLFMKTTPCTSGVH